MTRHRLLAALLLVSSAILATGLRAQNLVANPGFEAGNTGFSSDYQYAPGGNCCESQFTIRSNGSTFNPAFVNPPQASAGSSQMMVINGSTVPNQRIWYTTIAVTSGTTYRLQFAGCTAVAGGPAILQWQVAGQTVSTALPLPSITQTWQINGATWVAPTTGTVEIAIRNLNINAFPNDFYIDDIFVGPCQSCWTHYGNGFAGAQGFPNIAPSAPPQLGTTIDLQLTSVRPAQEFGLLVLGLAPASTPTPFGGTLLVAPLATVTLFVPGTPAAAIFPLVIPSNGSLAGLQIFCQFGHTDATAPAGFALSRGLQLVLGN